MRLLILILVGLVVYIAALSIILFSVLKKKKIRAENEKRALEEKRKKDEEERQAEAARLARLAEEEMKRRAEQLEKERRESEIRAKKAEEEWNRRKAELEAKYKVFVENVHKAWKKNTLPSSYSVLNVVYRDQEAAWFALVKDRATNDYVVCELPEADAKTYLEVIGEHNKDVVTFMKNGALAAKVVFTVDWENIFSCGISR